MIPTIIDTPVTTFITEENKQQYNHVTQVTGTMVIKEGVNFESDTLLDIDHLVLDNNATFKGKNTTKIKKLTLGENAVIIADQVAEMEILNAEKNSFAKLLKLEGLTNLIINENVTLNTNIKHADTVGVFRTAKINLPTLLSADKVILGINTVLTAYNSTYINKLFTSEGSELYCGLNTLINTNTGEGIVAKNILR